MTTLWALLIGRGEGDHAVRARLDDGAMHTLWSPVVDRERFAWLAGLPDSDVHAAPRRDRDQGAAEHSLCLWVRIASGKSVEALKRFRPAPTLVLRWPGTVQHVAFWSLDRALDPHYTFQANKRLAYALGCKQKSGDPWAFRFEPGWPVEFEQPEVYTARQVVGALKDPPEPKWKQAA